VTPPLLRTPAPHEAGPTARARVLAVAATVVLLLTAVGNVALFRAQEGDLADSHRALVRNPSDRLLDLTLGHGYNVGSRFTVYVWLGDRAPGSTVVVTPGYPFADEALLGLGQVTIEVSDHPGELDATSAAELRDAAVIEHWFARSRTTARESSRDRTGVPAVFAEGRFAVVVPDEAGAHRLLTYWDDDTVFLVEEGYAARRGLPGAGP
jgi:hypothetical protein